MKINYIKTLNIFNVMLINKITKFSLKKTKFNFSLFNILLKYNIIKYYKLNSNNLIKITNYNFKKTKKFMKIKIISKPTHQYIVSLNFLKKKFLKNKKSLYIMSTNTGIMDHLTAIKNNKGGIILFKIIL
jgi:ribosomal protein S8